MTPVQVAAEIKRLDKEIAKADEGIHASRALADSPKPLLALVSVFAVVGAILKVVIEHK
jgi:hypothetical protein